MIKITPLQKQSKREQREYHAGKRGSWNGICPVTKTVKSAKSYDRNRAKRSLAGDCGADYL